MVNYLNPVCGKYICYLIMLMVTFTLGQVMKPAASLFTMFVDSLKKIYVTKVGVYETRLRKPKHTLLRLNIIIYKILYGTEVS